MYKNKYLLKFYKFIHNIFKQPMFLNIFILGIFLVSIRFWYIFLVMFTTWLKDVHYFYLVFKLFLCFMGWYFICCYHERRKIMHLILSVLFVFLIFLSVTTRPPAQAESIQILTQLQRHQLTLLQSRIQLDKFGSTAPHLFTLFQSNFDNMWYIDTFYTYKNLYNNVTNYKLHRVFDFNGNRIPQYIARFQLDNKDLPKIWEWRHFKNISNNNLKGYFNFNYIQKQIYNKQFIYTRTGIRV